MSDTQVIMRFESLPNEILFQCLEYLNGVDVFYAFHQLNYRFNKLIRSIILSINFQIVRRSAFEKFCTIMLLNPEIKNQIYSLHLSNQNSSSNISMFLSIFSLEEFIHLRSLTLTSVTENEISKLKSMLPLLSQLFCFRLINYNKDYNDLLSVLSRDQMRILMVPLISWKADILNEFSLITSLTVGDCGLVKLFMILRDTTKLIYLSINHLYNDLYSEIDDDIVLLNLNYLIIMRCEIHSNTLKILFERTPNLHSLIICNESDRRTPLMNANQWQDLITSSLLHLNIFKFKFQYFNDDIKERFQEFQDDFWCQQHHWFTEYSLLNNSGWIYTIPYIFDTYELTAETKRYPNRSTTDINIFKNVKNLIIDNGAIKEKCQYYFSHVKSLTLQDSWLWLSEDGYFETKHLERLKKMMNLSNIKHLTISSSLTLKTSDILTELLEQASQIISLTISSNELISLFNNNRLCKYLNKMIKILDVHLLSESSFNTSSGLKQFCEVFSNLEQLTCTINQPESLIYLFQHLLDLSFINVFHSQPYREYISWLEKKTQELNIKITIVDNSTTKNVSIWIIRNTHTS